MDPPSGKSLRKMKTSNFETDSSNDFKNPSTTNSPNLTIFKISELFNSFLSDKDSEAASLLNRLELLLSWQGYINKGIKTKDPILDLAVNILRLYGIKLQIFYQDKME
jgi:hypothetical protein